MMNLLDLISDDQRTRFKKHGTPKLLPLHGAYYRSIHLGLRVICLGCRHDFDAGGFPTHANSGKCKRNALGTKAKKEVVRIYRHHVDVLWTSYLRKDADLMEEKARVDQLAWDLYRVEHAGLLQPIHDQLVELGQPGVAGAGDGENAVASSWVFHQGDGTEDDLPITLGEHVCRTIMIFVEQAENQLQGEA